MVERMNRIKDKRVFFSAPGVDSDAVDYIRNGLLTVLVGECPRYR
jgi:hypothetical protein